MSPSWESAVTLQNAALGGLGRWSTGAGEAAWVWSPRISGLDHETRAPATLAVMNERRLHTSPHHRPSPLPVPTPRNRVTWSLSSFPDITFTSVLNSF